jgi:hypothetical protein
LEPNPQAWFAAPENLELRFKLSNCLIAVELEISLNFLFFDVVTEFP